MTTDRELMQQALDAMLNFPNDISDEMFESIRVLRARLAQPEQEHSEQWWRHEVSNAWAEGYEKGRLQREWQWLTDEEINTAAYNNHPLDGIRAFARAIEAKLKEKSIG